jgi:hypothetical protein
MSIPSLFSITQHEIKTVIPSESSVAGSFGSNDHLSTKVTKTSSCGVNYKTLGQFALMIIQLIFQILILIKK